MRPDLGHFFVRHLIRKPMDFTQPPIQSVTSSVTTRPPHLSPSRARQVIGAWNWPLTSIQFEEWGCWALYINVMSLYSTGAWFCSSV